LFSQGVWFGVLLAIYMLLGFSAMTLLLMYRQWRHYRPKADGSGIGGQGSELGTPNGKPRDAAAGSEPRTVRWPLTGQRPEFSCLPGGGSRAGLGRDLFGRLGRMGLHSLALALVLFFAVPRLGQTTWRGAIGNPQPMVGYSDTVKLGELGQIIEDPGKVMEVQFYDPAKNRRVPVHGDIYLQGAILMSYQQGEGARSSGWQAGLTSWNVRTELLQVDPAETLPKSGLVSQEITIESMDHDELFFVAPFVPLASTIDISIDHGRQRLLRLEQSGRQFAYKLGTTAIVDGRQNPLVPSVPREARDRALQLPGNDAAKSLPRLTALAQQWLDASGLPRNDVAGQARYLERKLAMSGEFRYSLTGAERNPDIDPIEDFVSEHREGHCEYFATALTLMLRSQGIPARMIVGYKCDEWNPTRACFQVRQLHAHTWVEAYLTYRQIPQDLLHGKGYWPWRRGGWLRLDPTPAGAASAQKARWLAPVRDSMDWLDATWSKYVRDLDAEHQRDAIYGPIVRAAKAVCRALTDREHWRVFFSELAVRLRLDQLSGAAAWTMAVVVGTVAAAIAVGAGWLLWAVGRHGWIRWTGDHARLARLAEIEFYRRFEKLLARRGIRRAAGQTQREFAEFAGKRLALDTDDWRLAPLPGIVADAFYRVRFGGRPLDNPQIQAVEQAIQKILARCRRG
jgi:transglutaminase-like putative cysteine protease